MKVLHISDTHGYHDLLSIQDDIDMVIHSGDAANYRDPYTNEAEMWKFLDWYAAVPVRHKIYVPGNHDSSIFHGLIKPERFRDRGIHCVIDQSIEIDGVKLWGSPWTPTFGNWSYNRDRSKLNKLWMTIPDDTDVVITHGPPMGVLDLSRNAQGELEMCGCSALKKRVLVIQPRYHLFGHIHNYDNIINAGQTQLSGYKTVFSNASVVTDGRFGQLSSRGYIFDL